MNNDKPKRPQINLRLDNHTDLLAAVQEAAAAQNITVSAFTIQALKVAVGMEDEVVAPCADNKMLSMLDEKVESTLEEKLADETMLEKLADMVFEKLKKEIA